MSLVQSAGRPSERACAHDVTVTYLLPAGAFIHVAKERNGTERVNERNRTGPNGLCVLFLRRTRACTIVASGSRLFLPPILQIFISDPEEASRKVNESFGTDIRFYGNVLIIRGNVLSERSSNDYNRY